MIDQDAPIPPETAMVNAKAPHRPDFQSAWREMHDKLSWMQGHPLLKRWLGQNFADVANGLIDAAYPGLRDRTATSLTITEAASQPREGDAYKIHFEKMQDMMRRYIEPITYVASFPADGTKHATEFEEPGPHDSGTNAETKRRRMDRAFIADMIHMMDGPEQRALTRRPPEQAGAVPAGLREYAQRKAKEAKAESQKCAGRHALESADRWDSAAEAYQDMADRLSAAPTPPDAGPGEIPAGMVAWHGGIIAPDDWDGGDVLLKGHIRPCFVTSWRGQMGDPEIIAYTPKAPPQTPPDAGIGSDGAGLEAAAQLAYRICAETRHVTLGDKIADAIRALATQPGDGGQS